MAIKRIDSVFDIDTLKGEYAEYKELLTNSQTLLEELFAATKENKTSNLSGFTAAVEKLSTAIEKSTASYDAAVKKNSELVKSAKDVITANQKAEQSFDDSADSANK